MKYVADHDGYRLEMKSNEPGTKQESPASAVFQIEDPPQGAYRQVIPRFDQLSIICYIYNMLLIILVSKFALATAVFHK